QVRLAETDTAVDEERVVGLRRKLGDGLAGGLRELVGRADDEGIENVARVQPFRGAAARRAAGRRWRWIVGGGRDGVVDDDAHARLAADHLGGGLLERLKVVLREPVTREPVRGADAEVIALDGEQSARSYPRVHHGGSELVGGGFDEASPKAIQHWPRPHLHTQLSTGGDNSVAPRSMGYPRR